MNTTKGPLFWDDRVVHIENLHIGQALKQPGTNRYINEHYTQQIERDGCSFSVYS